MQLKTWILAPALLASANAHAETITGTASVIDGDTIEIHEQRIRLWGIDAPESRQTCGDQGKEWRCGQRAALALSDKIGRGMVSCEVKDTDRYKRNVAICSSAGVELNAWLVREGWAVDYTQYSKGAYSEDQASAKEAGRNIWSGEFVEPAEFRRRKRVAAPLR